LIKNISVTIALLLLFTCSWGQATFKAGWNTYKTGMLIHEYTYSYIFKDSARLYYIDSTQIFVSPDSLATLTIEYPANYRTATYLNTAKQVIKKDEYKGENLQVSSEWKYDAKGRKIFHSEDNKLNGNVYKHNYDYSVDKATGYTVVQESSFFNGKAEFYTKDYYDKNHVKVKQVRLNDNNHDIVHVETYIYDKEGRLTERSVFFPEFQVTKKFPEIVDDNPIKCRRFIPIMQNETFTISTKVSFLKKFLTKNQVVILDKDCKDFDYKFTNGHTVDVEVSSTKTNNKKQVKLQLKQYL